MRHALSAILLFAAALPTFAQVPKAKSFPPDAATKATITAKLDELRAAVAAIPADNDRRPDVAIYLNAVERAVRLDEWLTKDAPKQAVTVLDAGLKRAAELAAGKPSWRELRGKSVVRGYVSSVDGIVQPYALTLPAPAETYRLDVVLHGRDGTLSEVKFLAQRESAKAATVPPGTAILEVFGRGNNAYRWAGEVDVAEALREVQRSIRSYLPVLRGFSMGGAGTWHYGLHHPFDFHVLGPGAGFTTTRGYVKLPDDMPEWQKRCLTIYDAVDVAENVCNVPVVAYSGANDKQKAAADNIIAALKDFKEPYTLKHLVAPGLEHKMPPVWQAKAEAEFTRVMTATRSNRTRYVLYTTAFPNYGNGHVTALERHYEKAVLDMTFDKGAVTIRTKNIRSFTIGGFGFGGGLSGQIGRASSALVDGQYVGLQVPLGLSLVKTGDRWEAVSAGGRFDPLTRNLTKTVGLQGPIDDAFRHAFAVGPGPAGDSPVTKSLAVNRSRFAGEWDRYMHGTLRELTPEWKGGRVLFGTSETPAVAAVLPKLPITWTADKLTVNGVEYDPKTHYPALIYPDPANPSKYLVLNSGHTFHAKEFEGSNALLYPRLGDWAVLKLAPTAADPAATETVASGLFDENWRFEK